MPALIGVIVVGFVIGAALSMVGSVHGVGGVALAPSPSISTTPLATMPLSTPSRKAFLTPYPAVVPTIAHTPPSEPQPLLSQAIAPSISPSVVSTVVLSAAPIATQTTASVDATATPQLTPLPLEPPEPTNVETEMPPSSPAPTDAPTVVPEGASTSLIDVDSEFAQEAAQAVHAYLTDLQHGDEDSASAALEGASGSALLEESFMDRSARIMHIHATGTSTLAAVQAHVFTKQGRYVVTFSVERGPKGPIIRTHEFVKETS